MKRKIHIKVPLRFLFLLLFVSVFLGAAAPGWARDPVPDGREHIPHLLVITSQPYVTQWFSSLDRAFGEELHKNLSPPAKVSYEYMDGKKLADPRFVSVFKNLLREKYRHLGIDLVMAVMPAGSGFLLSYGEEVFPGIPKLFLLSGKDQIPKILAGKKTGLVESTSDIAGTIERIRLFLPGTERLFVVSGSGEDDLSYRERTRRAVEQLRWPREVVYLDGVPPRELADRLSHAPANSAVLILTYVRDREGNPCTTVQVMKELSPRANAPIFGFYDTLLGLGIIGGYLSSAEAYGKAAAAAAVKMISRRDVGYPLKVKAEIRNMYDWREIERWRISPDLIPEGSILINRKKSFWEENRDLVVLALLVFAAQAALIAALLFNLVKRHRIEQILRANEQELLRHREHLEAMVEERTQQLRMSNLELVQAKEHAETADKMKSAFLATMSHELRTPLNSIIGFTGIILQGLVGPLNDEQRKQLLMVRTSANHLLSLINDILDISKIESGQLQISRETFDLRATIEKLVQTFRPLTEMKGLTFHVDIAPEVGELQSDARRVEQIILNLLSNAVKFTEAGGVSVSCTLAEGNYILQVADTGIGVKEEHIEEMFTPFRQIDTGVSRKYEGTGLGLSICKKLLELLGGEIRVESEWQRGTTFTVSIPVKGNRT